MMSHRRCSMKRALAGWRFTAAMIFLTLDRVVASRTLAVGGGHACVITRTGGVKVRTVPILYCIYCRRPAGGARFYTQKYDQRAPTKSPSPHIESCSPANAGGFCVAHDAGAPHLSLND